MKPMTSFKNSEPTYQDKEPAVINGFYGIYLHILLGLLILLFQSQGYSDFIVWTFSGLGVIFLNSYVIVQPNEAVVAQFFGKYSSTLKTEGFKFYVNPFYSKTRLSLRINNFESNKLKVNDVNANPIDIAAVIVWRVFDAAEALFEVEDFEDYVQIQGEAALREMATKYPYDAIEQKDIGGITLSSHQDAVAEELQTSVWA